MAASKKQEEYTSKAITTSIRFTSRASVKIKDNFFTVEACEERTIPDIEGVDIQKEKRLLWDAVNSECDDQISDILKIYK